MLIDRQLADAGWVVQDRKDLSLFADEVSSRYRLAHPRS